MRSFKKARFVFLSFNIFPSLTLVATNDRKQNKCYNIVLYNKRGQLFLKFS